MRRLRIAGLLALAVFGAGLIGAGMKPASAQVLELDAIVVEGRIQRPQASYIIKRASIDFGIQAKRKSFVDKIVQSIKDDPF